MYRILESVLGASWRWNPCFHCWRQHGFLTQPELASQYVSTLWELEKLLGNRFSDMNWKARKRTAKKWTEWHGIPKFRGFKKNLATSTTHFIPFSIECPKLFMLQILSQSHSFAKDRIQRPNHSSCWVCYFVPVLLFFPHLLHLFFFISTKNGTTRC